MNNSNCLCGISCRGYRLMTAFALLLCVGSARAQDINICDYLDQALNRVEQQMRNLDLEGYDCAPGNAFLGAFLSEGGSQSMTATLRGGREYLVIGGADNDVQDLDLACTDSDSGVTIWEDGTIDPYPILRITPRRTGQYAIKMTNFRAKDNGFGVFIILQKSNNGEISIGELTEAFTNAVAVARRTCESAEFVLGGICMFGGKIGQNGESMINNIRLDAGEYACRGACSDSISDLDMDIIRQTNYGATTGTTIATDHKTNNSPACNFLSRRNNYYQLKTSVADANTYAGGYAFSILLKMSH